MGRAARPSSFHMSDSRLQFKFGKPKTKIVREHIAKRLDPAYCATIHLA
jgi:hypothetical protein